MYTRSALRRSARDKERATQPLLRAARQRTEWAWPRRQSRTVGLSSFPSSCGVTNQVRMSFGLSSLTTATVPEGRRQSSRTPMSPACARLARAARSRPARAADCFGVSARSGGGGGCGDRSGRLVHLTNDVSPSPVATTTLVPHPSGSAKYPLSQFVCQRLRRPTTKVTRRCSAHSARAWRCSVVSAQHSAATVGVDANIATRRHTEWTSTATRSPGPARSEVSITAKPRNARSHEILLVVLLPTVIVQLVRPVVRYE